ncbi:hypothetical protein CEUSTIGMA_g8219.t1 [Chlamydomonas eustigma]|uniref:BZIP domain-containing protein n=1 Tax=Chlamydomonas eustigma TaxID=1157962 RepID=A0A250XCG5_9CHLO|nr:hypothetical protein CEUSTIGMA_g8219.t1 [Chlamydomonas eustigma]|eukprot:GAX80783.1 hypothetical protein CEUSTIGMA_g8219.t1 [Chlamydomonas eustigma]
MQKLQAVGGDLDEARGLDVTCPKELLTSAGFVTSWESHSSHQDSKSPSLYYDEGGNPSWATDSASHGCLVNQRDRCRDTDYEDLFQAESNGKGMKDLDVRRSKSTAALHSVQNKVLQLQWPSKSRFKEIKTNGGEAPRPMNRHMETTYPEACEEASTALLPTDMVKEIRYLDKAMNMPVCSEELSPSLDLSVFDEEARFTLSKLTSKRKDRGKGGRNPSKDARLDPSIDPKKAARIMANRLSAARSKLRQKASSLGLTAKLSVLMSQRLKLSKEVERLKSMCEELEGENEHMLSSMGPSVHRGIAEDSTSSKLLFQGQTPQILLDMAPSAPVGMQVIPLQGTSIDSAFPKRGSYFVGATQNSMVQEGGVGLPDLSAFPAFHPSQREESMKPSAPLSTFNSYQEQQPSTAPAHTGRNMGAIVLSDVSPHGMLVQDFDTAGSAPGVPCKTLQHVNLESVFNVQSEGAECHFWRQPAGSYTTAAHKEPHMGGSVVMGIPVSLPSNMAQRPVASGSQLHLPQKVFHLPSCMSATSLM